LTYLKEKNAKKLWAVAALNMALFVLLSVGFRDSEAEIWKFATWVSIQSIGVLMARVACDAIEGSLKEKIVFFRIHNALPGHRAFSHHVKNDSRIDQARLKKLLGDFPEKPRDQNEKWYAIYQKHQNRPTILGIQGEYLLYRDATALLTILMLVSLIFTSVFALSNELAVFFGLLILQWIIFRSAAVVRGNRLVTTVLATESSAET